MDELNTIIREIINKYISEEHSEDDNLLGITAVRNIIYILEELETIFKFEINDDFISNVKEFSINNLVAVMKNILI